MNCMSVKTFVDTNVLVYAHDLDAQEKHLAAKEALSRLWADRTGVLSTQVLQEFYVAVTRKLPRPLSKTAARKVIDTYVVWCVDVTHAEITAAFRIEDQARISFWDALICATALTSGAERLLSEYLNA